MLQHGRLVYYLITRELGHVLCDAMMLHMMCDFAASGNSYSGLQTSLPRTRARCPGRFRPLGAKELLLTPSRSDRGLLKSKEEDVTVLLLMLGFGECLSEPEFIPDPPQRHDRARHEQHTRILSHG